MSKDDITKEQMEQYEQMRQLGLHNMFDYRNVVRSANKFGMEDLANTSLDEYKTILQHFSELMKKFGIKQ